MKGRAPGLKHAGANLEPKESLHIGAIGLGEARFSSQRNQAAPQVRSPRPCIAHKFLVNEKAQLAPGGFGKRPGSAQLEHPAMDAGREGFDAPLPKNLWYWTTKEVIG